MMRHWPARAAAVVAACAIVLPARAQTVPRSEGDSLAPIVSMGQPSPYYPYAGVVGGWDRRAGGSRGAARLVVGVDRGLIQPVVGVLGIAAEGYVGTVGGAADGGARLLATARVLRLGVGSDVSFTGRRASFVLTITEPVRRGGVFGGGSELRLEWLRRAGRSSWAFGATLPLLQPWAGRTRPHDTDVHPPANVPARARRAPGSDDARAEQAIARLRRAALAIDVLTTPAFRPRSRGWLRDMRRAAARMSERDADYPRGHSFPIEIDAYHRALVAAFAAVAPGTARGAAVAARARGILLDEVLIPYDAYYGRFRDPSVLAALSTRAADRFTRSLPDDHATDEREREAASAVFARVLDVVREVAAAARHRWGDSRDVWIPLQLALRPEDYDTQAKIDRVVERVVGRDLQPGNDVAFLPPEAFSRALRESIRDTRSYHVLWTHDFAGVTPSGAPDSIAFRTVLAYLDALTRGARAFDHARSLPRFMIFLDQWFYSAKKGRRWMSVLEDPLHHRVRMPPVPRGGDAELRAALDSLRAAVAGSAALQAEARRRGSRWLTNVMSVRVSITNPADPAFSGPRLVPNDLRESLSDNWMRDHRKIVFWDVDEHHPARGGALFTGEGVGEEYENAGWEDRTLVVRGPGVLALRRDAADLLRSQGFRDEQIPAVLRSAATRATGEARVDSLVRAGWTARVLVAQNGTGYLDKHASALKATLYTLMPAGSRIVAPSPFWGSHVWASMLLGSALRGCHVMVMAPTRANFPGPPYLQLATTRDVLEGLIRMRGVWRGQLAAVDGRLRTGLFHNVVATRDVIGRLRELAVHLRRNRFVREEFPFRPELYDVLERPDSLFRRLRLGMPVADAPGDSAHPKLHLKTQLFASASALRTMLALPEWDSVLTAYAVARVASSRAPSRRLPPAFSVGMLAPLDRAPAARASAAHRGEVLYLTVGSHNEDDLSRTHNGEVLCLVAGRATLTAAFDFVYLVASASWVDSVSDLDRLLPRSGWFERLLASWEAQVL
ncbi:MAG TPA: hypothetical protein VFS44_01700 [Gemmatimonadaceae bacterium]|nr:hypothetical protein [Gemmatimonadaceae bacterium]